MKKFLLVIMLGVLTPTLVLAQMAKELHATAMECWELQDYACAEIYLQDLIKLEKDSEQLADYCLKLGSILSESGDSKEAFKMFKMALKKNPESVEAYVKRGELYSSEGNSKKDLSYFYNAMENDADRAPAISKKS